MNVREVVAHLEKLAPKELAEKWDNVGLLIGSYDAPVKTILFTLDVNSAVVSEAIAKQVDLIIVHHPPIFNGQKSMVEHDVQQKKYIALLRHHISVYAAHTNIDNAPKGMNYWLANALGLEQSEILLPQGEWENEVYGTGRIGMLSYHVTLADFVAGLEHKVITHGIRFVGEPTTLIQKVALCGGAVVELYPTALEKNADVYVTGDVKYHDAQDMLAQGLCVIDAGHYIEAIFKEKMYAYYEQWNEEMGLELNLIMSEINTDPFQFRK